MRPPEFTGGNQPLGLALESAGAHRFNEAAGIHRRKRPRRLRTRKRTTTRRFNEAAGIHRRKHGCGRRYS